MKRAATAGLILAVVAGAAGCASTQTKTVAGPTVSVTQDQLQPGRTVTQTVTPAVTPHGRGVGAAARAR